MLSLFFYIYFFITVFFFFLFCSVKVCEMMFSLASKLATARTSGAKHVHFLSVSKSVILILLLFYYHVNLFVPFYLAREENGIPKARTEEISLKLTSLPSEPPRRETQCLKSQTEGATAKVIDSPDISTLCFFTYLHLSFCPTVDIVTSINKYSRVCVSHQCLSGMPRSSTY